MHFAVIGDKGMFGQDMFSMLESKGERVAGYNRDNLDLNQTAEELARVIAEADFIINAVAYTKVDAAEDEVEVVTRTNGHYAGKLAQVSTLLGSKLMHISTDYVFSGELNAAFKPSDTPNPINAYGKSKLLGERLITESGARAQIFRTAWLFGEKSGCFPRSIAKQLFENHKVNVVNDQYGQPTWTRDLAEVVYDHCLNDFEEPIVHAVASGSASWFDFAQAIGESLPNPDSYSINPISTSSLGNRAKRPVSSLLENNQTKGPVIGNWLERWRVAAPEVLRSNVQ